jgi:hypothetical protein
MRMVRYAGIALVSAATLLLELALLRLFAVQQFYHFAFMAVSLALLGAGATGSLLTLRQRPIAVRWLRLRPWICILFSLSVIIAYLIINYLPFDSFSIAWDSRQLLYLALYFLAATVPFLFSGLLVGGELMQSAASGSHRVYGANLFGSAVGTLASLPALAEFGGEGAVQLAALLGILSALLFFLLDERRAPDGEVGPVSRFMLEWRVALSGLLIAFGILFLFRPPPFMAQTLSPYKTLSLLIEAKDTRHVLTRWDATARVDVVESGAIHLMPGLSLSSPVGLPPQAGLTLDGDNLMPIVGMSPDSQQAALLADNVPGGISMRLRPSGRALVIAAGTGMDVFIALAGGSQQVTAVEENELVIGLMQNEYEPFSHALYTGSSVSVVNQSGRVFARQQRSANYDVVVPSLTDPHRPVTSGAYSLTENYIYTIEAIADYLGLLNDTGLLVVTRWLQTPPSESVRLFATMATALTQTGRDPAEHLIAFRSLRTMTVIAGLQPIGDQEIEAVRAFLQERGYDAVYFPGISATDLNQYNLLSEPIYHNLFSAILTDPAQTVSEYRFDIRPPTDDHPFFFHFFKWQQAPEILARLGSTWQPFGGSGFFVLVALLVLVALASALFILAPLLFARSGLRISSAAKGRWRARAFIYFAALGLAFLFVEMPLAQRFILIMGQPVTALAVVLFSILIFSALGSLCIGWIPMRWALGVLVLIIGLYPLLLEPVSRLALGWPEPYRIMLTVLVLAPLGFLMGIPFAAGLRIVERYEPALVPWAWAINGSFSVISAVLALMGALSWGFSTVLWSGALAYAVAWLMFARAHQYTGVAYSG